MQPGSNSKPWPLATLDDAGLGGLDVEVDGDVLRLVGDVDSQADVDAAMTAIKDMPGMTSEMTVESALVVGAGAADDDSGPDPVEDEPSYTG